MRKRTLIHKPQIHKIMKPKEISTGLINVETTLDLSKFEQIISRLPGLKFGRMPVWHHHHSFKVDFVGYNNANSPQNKTLILESNAIEVKIYRAPETSAWIFEYKIRQPVSMFFSGKVWMSKEDLETVFGLSNKCEKMWGQGILDSYGGDVAYQGKYIRYKNFLNVPGPGTGDDGDPNVSIEINDVIKEEIKFLIE